VLTLDAGPVAMFGVALGRCGELHSASFIYLFCAEASLLLFPLGDRRQARPPLQRFARRDGHPGRDAHSIAGGRRKDVL
jgi:hypothetical protein